MSAKPGSGRVTDDSQIAGCGLLTGCISEPPPQPPPHHARPGCRRPLPHTASSPFASPVSAAAAAAARLASARPTPPRDRPHARRGRSCRPVRTNMPDFLQAARAAFAGAEDAVLAASARCRGMAIHAGACARAHADCLDAAIVLAAAAAAAESRRARSSPCRLRGRGT
jgi:hypothetical protein